MTRYLIMLMLVVPASQAFGEDAKNNEPTKVPPAAENGDGDNNQQPQTSADVDQTDTKADVDTKDNSDTKTVSDIKVDWTTTTYAIKMHAEAIVAEIKGQYDLALALLRTAAELAPKHELIAFDRARMAQLYGGEAQDIQAFMAHSKPAEEEATDAISLLRRSLDANPPVQGMGLGLGWVTGRLRIGSRVDTNAGIGPKVPDNASAGNPADAAAGVPAAPMLGVRFVTDGVVMLTALRDPVSIDGAIKFNMGRFFNAKAATPGNPSLSEFDSGSVGAALNLRYELDMARLNVLLSGNEVFTANFSKHFMQSVDLKFDALLVMGDAHFGPYASVQFRDFVDDNNEDTAFDRDGPRVNVGLAWDWGEHGRVGFVGHVGWLQEFAQGDAMVVQGLNLLMAINMHFDKIHGMVGYYHEARVYSAKSPGQWGDEVHVRVDNRINPFVSASFDINRWMGVYADYHLTLNASTDAKQTELQAGDRRYQRHVVGLGVEGRL